MSMPHKANPFPHSASNRNDKHADILYLCIRNYTPPKDGSALGPSLGNCNHND